MAHRIVEIEPPYGFRVAEQGVGICIWSPYDEEAAILLGQAGAGWDREARLWWAPRSVRNRLARALAAIQRGIVADAGEGVLLDGARSILIEREAELPAGARLCPDGAVEWSHGYHERAVAVCVRLPRGVFMRSSDRWLFAPRSPDEAAAVIEGLIRAHAAQQSAGRGPVAAGDFEPRRKAPPLPRFLTVRDRAPKRGSVFEHGDRLLYALDVSSRKPATAREARELVRMSQTNGHPPITMMNAPPDDEGRHRIAVVIARPAREHEAPAEFAVRREAEWAERQASAMPAALPRDESGMPLL